MITSFVYSELETLIMTIETRLDANKPNTPPCHPPKLKMLIKPIVNKTSIASGRKPNTVFTRCNGNFILGMCLASIKPLIPFLDSIDQATMQPITLIIAKITKKSRPIISSFLRKRYRLPIHDYVLDLYQLLFFC